VGENDHSDRGHRHNRGPVGADSNHGIREGCIREVHDDHSHQADRVDEQENGIDLGREGYPVESISVSVAVKCIGRARYIHLRRR
jgi:hypothetical protein